PSGALDTGVGSQGFVTVPTWADTFALDSAGRILLIGTTANDQALELERLTPAFVPDLTFGTAGDGTTTAVIPGPPTTGFVARPRFAFAPDGRIIVVGSLSYAPTGGATNGNMQLFGARFQPSGTLDPTFGT